MRRREFLTGMGTGALATVLPIAHAASARNQNTKPNIIVILVDDLGYGDLSSYGATDLKTPNIDGLMAAGMRFDRFYANCPVCSPTRAALLTGRYPDMVGVPGVIRTHITNNWGYLSPHATLLPQVLKQAGYHTGIVGKWHLGLSRPNTPNERGFDHFHGFLGDMMDDYYHHRRHGHNYMRLNDTEIDPEGHATDLFTQWAVEYITERGTKDRKQRRVEGVSPSNRGQDARDTEPFFLYLAYNAPHTPIQPPADWLEKIKRREPGISDKRAKLVALIEHLDAGIGRVIEAIDKAGIGDDTLVIFTSDNGGQLNAGANNGSLRAGKQDMYEGGIREPMCAVWPGKITPELGSQRVALTMDIFPTVCDAAGIDISHKIDGVSFLPTLRRQKQSDDDRFLFWVRREGGHYGGRAYYAARYGDFKLVQKSPFEPYQLFNLSEDPTEEKPLEENHPMYDRLFGALRNHIIEAGAVPWERYPVDLDVPLTH